MNCYLREFLALRRYRVLGPDGADGALVGIVFGRPDWPVESLVADLGTRMHVAPEHVRGLIDDPPCVRLDAMERPSGTDAEPTPLAPGVDAESLLGCAIVSSGDKATTGSVADLLINVNDWHLKYFVVDNGTRLVLLHASWVRGASVGASRLLIDGVLPRALQSAPAYAGLATLTPGYEDVIYRHYTRRDFIPDARPPGGTEKREPA